MQARIEPGAVLRAPRDGHVVLALDTGTRLRVAASARVRIVELGGIPRGHAAVTEKQPSFCGLETTLDRSRRMLTARHPRGRADRRRPDEAAGRSASESAREFLGLDGFSALECSFGQGRVLAFVDSNGDTVVLRPRPEANLQALRERLGL